MPALGYPSGGGFIDRDDSHREMESLGMRVTASRATTQQGAKVGELERRCQRDQSNAELAQRGAQSQLPKATTFRPQADMAHGVSDIQIGYAAGIDRDRVDLERIARRPFDAMVEADVKSAGRDLSVLWYVHRDTSGNQSIATGDGREIRILSWTHPGAQIALSGQFQQTAEIKRRDLALRAVTPLARARFDRVSPDICGVYEPGGTVGELTLVEAKTVNLKAVKLDMTPEQVQAFINRQNGLMFVIGAPGTGKTTVAFQRIRFLFDQQEQTDQEHRNAPYGPELTQVFLASRNLIGYTRSLLRDELHIPPDVVAHVGDFVHKYVERVWQPKLDARPITRKMSVEETRAREAFLNLGDVGELRGMWQCLEAQVRTRLASGTDEWAVVLRKEGSTATKLAAALAAELAAVPSRKAADPLDSVCRMDRVWQRARLQYDACRSELKGRRRDEFDDRFAKWLLTVYDPLDVLRANFGGHRQQSIARIKAGTGSVLNPAEVVDSTLRDWRQRRYGQAEEAWIAWLLRFALPEDSDPEDGFRVVARAVPRPSHEEQRRWTHVVIDEAQDLSVQEASLLGSFVDPNGALTVSADFRQVVSPVHGMTNGEALKVGLAIRDQTLHTTFPFRTNMRQSREISQFLRDFYQNVFGEFPPFDSGTRLGRVRPQLHTGPEHLFAGLLRQLMNVLSKKQTPGTTAILSIDEGDERMRRLRSALLGLGLAPLPIDELVGGLVMTTVERAKGLEYDTVVVLGLDDVERSSVNFWKNRAYVALSRPTTRLVMLCEEFPHVLRTISKDYFEHHLLA